MPTRLARFDALDRIAGPTSRWVAALSDNPTLKDTLSGTWLGHPVHPMLTDLPIGFWTSAFVLDLLGGKSSRRAAQRLVGLGVLSALPTAVTGAADWSDTDTGDKRVGVVHGILNTAALVAFGVVRSAHPAPAPTPPRHRTRIARRDAGDRGGVPRRTFVDARGVGVSHTAFDPQPEEWTPVCQFGDVSDEPLRVSALGGSVVVAHVGPEIVAVSATCPHRGAPLDEGKTEAGTITCPWHGSCFRLSTARCSAARRPCRSSATTSGSSTARSRSADPVEPFGCVPLRMPGEDVPVVSVLEQERPA